VDTPLKFLTWNLRNGGAGAVDSSEERREEQETYLAQQRPDILGLTELKNWDQGKWWRLHDMETATGMVALPPVISRSGHGAHLALLYRPGRVRVRACSTTEGGDTFHHGLAEAHITAGERDAVVLLTHLSPFDGARRSSEARWLTKYATPGAEVVLIGDLNVIGASDPEPDWTHIPPHEQVWHRVQHPDGSLGPADRSAMHTLRNAGYQDLPDRLGRPAEPTVGHWPSGPPVPRRLDHVMPTGPTAEGMHNHRTHNTAQTRALSDHLPVSVEWTTS
jgi:endonuclease/exonuclease/phosphatase family metal-dependent hydrolase